jgi:DnaJ-class molecular chaperone
MDAPLACADLLFLGENTMNISKKRVEDIAGYTKGNFFCYRCVGTGRFITMNLNGKPTGPAEQSCFRCNGKGYHTQADRKRNYGHTMNYMPF